MRYYYTNAQNQPVGPVEAEELLRLRAAGSLNANVQLCPEGGQQWSPFSAIEPALPASGPAAAPVTPAAPANATPGPGAAERLLRAGSLFSPLLDRLLEGVRGRLGPARLTAFFQGCVAWGHSLMLVGAGLALVTTFVQSARQNNYLLLGGALLGAGLLVVLQFAAQRFFVACAALVKNTPSQVGSSAVLDCLGLLLLAGALLAGCLGLVAAAAAQFAWAGQGLSLALGLLLGAGVCLSPSLAGVSECPSSAGEEAVGLLSFYLKGGLVLLPLSYLLCAVAGGVLTLTGLFGGTMATGLEPALPMFLSFGGMQGLFGLALQLFGTALVIVAYFVFLACYLGLDLMRALLCVPGKLDALKR